MSKFFALIADTELQTKRITKHRFRAGIFAAWSHRCAYCNEPADTLDHVIPRSAGGLTVAENLIVACRTCNRLKGSQPWHEWFLTQPWYCQQRAARISNWLQPTTKAA